VRKSGSPTFIKVIRPQRAPQIAGLPAKTLSHFSPNQTTESVEAAIPVSRVADVSRTERDMDNAKSLNSRHIWVRPEIATRVLDESLQLPEKKPGRTRTLFKDEELSTHQELRQIATILDLAARHYRKLDRSVTPAVRDLNRAFAKKDRARIAKMARNLFTLIAESYYPPHNRPRISNIDDWAKKRSSFWLTSLNGVAWDLVIQPAQMQ
jgi:hypothetical protein